jgi:superfamily II DNA or RNA helicase
MTLESGVQPACPCGIACRQVVITTVQTASRSDNISTFAAQGWQLVIIDEAHHAPADSYVGGHCQFAYDVLAIYTTYPC